nr:hypothetical protein CFP56_75508 [Quercus suber]
MKVVFLVADLALAGEFERSIIVRFSLDLTKIKRSSKVGKCVCRVISAPSDHVDFGKRYGPRDQHRSAANPLFSDSESGLNRVFPKTSLWVRKDQPVLHAFSQPLRQAGGHRRCFAFLLFTPVIPIVTELSQDLRTASQVSASDLLDGVHLYTRQGLHAISTRIMIVISSPPPQGPIRLRAGMEHVECQQKPSPKSAPSPEPRLQERNTLPGSSPPDHSAA